MKASWLRRISISHRDDIRYIIVLCIILNCTHCARGDKAVCTLRESVLYLAHGAAVEAIY